MKLKGQGIRSLARALESLRGKEAYDRVLAAMPSRSREAVERIKALEWYAVDVAAQFHAAVRDVLGQGTWDVSYELGREASRLDLTGVYKVMIRAVQYDTVWDRMERTWLHYCDGGDAKWFERGRGHAKAFVSGVAGYNVGMWQSIAGRIEAMLTLSGAKGPQVSAIDPTTTQCHFEAMWLE